MLSESNSGLGLLSLAALMWGVEETHLQLRTVLELNKFFCIRITLLAGARWPFFRADHRDFDKSFYNSDYNNNIINKKQKLSINKTKCFRHQTLLYPQGLRGKKDSIKKSRQTEKNKKTKKRAGQGWAHQGSISVSLRIFNSSKYR